MKNSLQILNNFIESCSSALREGGGRVTEARLAVIHCLAETSAPLTAKDIFIKLEKTTKIDQVSVYRILEALLNLDLVHQVFPSGGYIPCFHSSCSQSYHILTRCGACDSIEEMHVPSDKVEPLVHYLKNKKKFYPDVHVIQINGLCENCKSL